MFTSEASCVFQADYLETSKKITPQTNKIHYWEREMNDIHKSSTENAYCAVQQHCSYSECHIC